MKISFLLPTRGRSENLKLVLDSLENTCDSISNYEVILCFDNDDVKHIEEFDSWTKNYNFKKIVIDRCGYDNIHIYYNKAAEESSGDWLWVWNDDCEMIKKGWDTIISEYNGQFVIINPWNTRDVDAQYLLTNLMFPIFPRKYLELLGHLSPWNHIDTYTDHVVSVFNFPIKQNEWRIVHTHNKQNDQTTREIFYHRIPMPINQLTIDRTKISNYLKLINVEDNI